MNDTDNLKRTDFFIGPADRDAVGKALLSDFHVDGDFVVRESESAVGTLTLVCRMPGSKLLQKRIVCSQGIYSFQGSAKGFATVAALLAADGRNGGADPAFDALVYWAKAVWNNWAHLHTMSLTMTRARMKRCKALRPWPMVTGPAAAAVATAGRIGRKFEGADKIITATG